MKNQLLFCLCQFLYSPRVSVGKVNQFDVNEFVMAFIKYRPVLLVADTLSLICLNVGTSHRAFSNFAACCIY